MLLVGLLPASAVAQETVPRLQGLTAEPGDGSLDVSWTAATDAPGGYLVRWRLRQEGASFMSSQGVNTGTSYTITGLTNGMTYVVRVDKRDSGGNVIRGAQSAVAATPVADTPSTRPTVSEIKLTAGQNSNAAYSGGPYETDDFIWVSVKLQH